MTTYRKSLYDQAKDIKPKRENRDRGFERWIDVALGKVFSIGGDTELVYKPGYVWVHEWGMDHSPAQAFKGGITVKAGDWVMYQACDFFCFNDEIDTYKRRMAKNEKTSQV